MRLIRGAPGSGKSALVLREFKEALRAGQAGLRIVVPTATLVRHFRHELARDGVVFSPGCIVSLSRFACERAPELKTIPAGLLTAIVRDCLGRTKLPEFADVAGTEGIVATIVETIGHFENAGCTPDKLAGVRKLAPQGKAFERIWRAVDEAMRTCGYQSRTAIFRGAAANPAPARIWMDGFLTLSPLESEFVRGLARTCELTLTLDDSPATDEIRKLAMQLGAKDHALAPTPRKPQTATVEARSLEREVDEIARRVIELNQQGTPFRGIGIALRDPSVYLPLLRTTFDRFGIPARFYFSGALRTHPVATFLGGLISGALTDWDFESTLRTLRAHPKWGHTADFDRYDFAVREAMPGHGADALASLCESEWLRGEIESCLRTSVWKTERRTPADWHTRCESLAATLYRPGTLDAPRDHASVARERSHIAALYAWAEAVESIVPFWTDAARTISLDEFWRVAGAAIESATLHVTDDRVQAVHVMSAWEARQWDLDALFVCGVVDRDFPKRHPQNLLFPDHEIEYLHKAGIPLRKAAEQENQERWLFESLRTRATRHLMLSYPLHDASGKSAQRSRFLDLPAPENTIPCVPIIADVSYAGRAGQIHTHDLLAGMSELHKSISLTALEDLAQCRFKFFGARTLSLKSSPERPGERLQPRVTGSILHEALDRWLTDKSQDFVEVFEATFDETCRKQHIPAGYRLEVERIQFREIAERVRASERWQPDSSESEVKLGLDFPGGVTVNCRIDRIDRFGNDCVIVDYKSSKTENVKKLVQSRIRLQGPLYALAVRERMHLNPVAMVYWAVREDGLFGWGRLPDGTQAWEEMPPNWAADARARTIERLTGFLEGAVRAHPEETEQCRWCDFKTACRVEQQTLVAIEGAA